MLSEAKHLNEIALQCVEILHSVQNDMASQWQLTATSSLRSFACVLRAFVFFVVYFRLRFVFFVVYLRLLAGGMFGKRSASIWL